MPPPIVAAPTKALLAACDAIDAAIGMMLDARSSLRGYEKYSSTTEALLLFSLVIRQIEGVLTAARHDMVLLPPAYSCARATLETAARAAWLVDANDPFVREARWLAYMQEEERVSDRAAKRYSEIGQDASAFEARSAEIRKFRTDVERMLPPGVIPQKHNPTMEEMLATLQGKHLYPLYIYLSQYVHGGHAATWLYRRGLGAETRPGEYIRPADWYIPFRICWLSLKEPGSLMLSRIGFRRRSPLSASDDAKIVAAIEKIKTSEH